MPANPFQDGISVEIQGDSSDLNNALGSASTGLTSFKKKVGLAGGALAALAAGGMAVAINEARKFQAEMVELEKVTNPETANQMSAAIMEMAKTIPLAQTELAQIASDAGRFGIEGPKNIESFTRAVSKMATATDISAQQAGEALAKLAELTGTPITKVENLGSSINELSNNFATSAQEIVDSMLRSSAAMSQFGLSQTEIAGFSAALNAVSESSERAGTRMRRLVQEITNPKKIMDMARALGMNVDQYKAMQENNPRQLLLRMIEGFKEGGRTANILNTNLSTTSRQALAGLSQNLDGVNRALDMSAKSFRENTSLQKEFDTASKTFNSRLQILKNRLTNVAITIGNQLLPPTIKLINLIARGVEKFSQWNQKTNGVLSALTLVGAAITGLVTVVAVLVNAVGGVAAIMGAASTVAAGLGTAFTILTGPIGLVVAAIAALAIAWQQNLFGIRDHTRTALSAVQNIIGRVLGWIRSQWAEHGDRITSEARKTWEFIRSTISEVMTRVRAVIAPALNWLSSQWAEHGDAILAKVRFVFDAIKGYIEFVIDGLVTAIVAFLRLIRGDWEGALEAMEDFFKRTFNGLLGWIRRWDIVDTIRGVFRDAGDAAGAALRHAFNAAVPSSVDLPSATIAGQTIGGGSLDLPQLDTGGLIQGDGLAMLHEGEAVLPKSQVDRGAITGGSIEINVDARGSSNPRATRRQANHGVTAALEAHNVPR